MSLLGQTLYNVFHHFLVPFLVALLANILVILFPKYKVWEKLKVERWQTTIYPEEHERQMNNPVCTVNSNVESFTDALKGTCWTLRIELSSQESVYIYTTSSRIQQNGHCYISLLFLQNLFVVLIFLWVNAAFCISNSPNSLLLSGFQQFLGLLFCCNYTFTISALKSHALVKTFLLIPDQNWYHLFSPMSVWTCVFETVFYYSRFISSQAITLLLLPNLKPEISNYTQQRTSIWPLSDSESVSAPVSADHPLFVLHMNLL